MIFKINDVKFYVHPNENIVKKILEAYQTTFMEIEKELKQYRFSWNNKNQGFQIELSEQLKNLFVKLFIRKNGIVPYTEGNEIKYSSKIDLRADVAIKRYQSNKGVYIEIEFRPNEFKDIVKFEIGYNNQFAELGILIVAQNRKHINPSYTTMPQYNRCKKIIEELKPNCPILLIGIEVERI